MSAGDLLASFWCAGVPGLKGSATAAPYRKANGKLGVRAFNANTRCAAWSESVRLAAMDDVRQRHGASYRPVPSPVAYEAVFYFERPKSHSQRWGKRGKLPMAVSRRVGDLTKLARAVEDPLTGVVWVDDSQVVRIVATKSYAQPGESPGVRVRVWSVGL
jgi:Holliday junction resolvase RusA-like endonuclease